MTIEQLKLCLLPNGIELVDKIVETAKIAGFRPYEKLINQWTFTSYQLCFMNDNGDRISIWIDKWTVSTLRKGGKPEFLYNQNMDLLATLFLNFNNNSNNGKTN